MIKLITRKEEKINQFLSHQQVIYYHNVPFNELNFDAPQKIHSCELKVVLLTNIIMLSVVMLRVILLSIFMLSVVKPNGFVLGDVMLSEILLND